MTPKEADRIIATHMCRYILKDSIVTSGTIIGPVYSKSLDSLAPVWEKLTVTSARLSPKIGNEGEDYIAEIIRFASVDQYRELGFGKTIQEAAAIATAELIKIERTGLWKNNNILCG